MPQSVLIAGVGASQGLGAATATAKPPEANRRAIAAPNPCEAPTPAISTLCGI